MLALRVYSIFIIVMLLIGVANMVGDKKEDKAAAAIIYLSFIPVLITLIYGGVC